MSSDVASSSSPAIEVRGLGKQYQLGESNRSQDRLTEAIASAFRSRRRRDASSIWAVRDVTFDVQQGEILGVIGRNGAGKSTLLKILSRITEPTTGEAIARGRVASLLEVGTGFHPELTGRENVFLSGSILGMRRAEIISRFDEIVGFADIDRFLDTPVKRYSSGMLVRLGFAVAAHLDPEILLVDEVLAVGDAAFQRKSLAKMEDVSRGGRTVILVSHNLASVESLCTTGLLIDDGTVASHGPVRTVVDRYLELIGGSPRTDLATRTDRKGDGRLRFVAVEANLRLGALGAITLEYEAEAGLKGIEISVALFTSRGVGAVYLANNLSGDILATIPTRGTFRCEIPKSAILPGHYSINIYCTSNGVLLDWIVGAAEIDVGDGDYFGTGKTPPSTYGSVTVDHHWSVTE